MEDETASSSSYTSSPSSPTATQANIGGNSGSSGNYTGEKPVVQVERPQKRSFEGTIEITGSVQANQVVHLHAMEGGIVKSIKKDIGDYVKRGQVIAVLENPELYQQMKKAEAGIKMAEAKYKQADAKLQIARASIRKYQAIVNARSATFQRLKQVAAKAEDLVTAEDLETAEAEWNIAMAELDAAKATPASAQAEIDAANAEKEGATAMREAVNVRSEMLTVTAPFSGYIANRYVDNGTLLQNAISNPNAKPIVDIVDVSKVRLVIDYPESDIAYISKGTPVKIDFPELGGKPYEAKITRMAAALNPQSKTVRAEIDLPNKGGKIKPGMYAKVSTSQKSPAGNLSVNTQAITSVKNQLFIYKVNDNQVQKIPVRVGLEDKHHIEVISDQLSENDFVVVQGKGLISDGMEVIAKEKGGK